MRDYQRKTTKYILPNHLYKQTLETIRDYHRMKEEADSILSESPAPPDGQPKGQSLPTSGVERKALRRLKYMGIIAIIDNAKNNIPEEYRTGIWNNILYHEPYPCDAHRVTYSNHKSKFIHEIAREIFFLD